jgi:NADPH:quinone reductase-like Zn-dependent oxidoreductase
VVALALVALAVAYWRSDNDCAELLSRPPADPMRAVLACDYGSSEVLRIARIEKPKPGDDEVRVRVRAVSVNPLDWHFMRGTPYLMRIQAGLRKPKGTQPGVDFAGTVDAVGRNVTDFKPGDDVFGGRNGAFAEYVCVRHDRAIAHKPPEVSFEQAAAVPIAGLTALQGLRDRAQLRPGQKVLINGASGGVGTFAVQIAKHLGAEVTGVCSTRNLELVRSLGADHAIDYTREDFTQGPQRYDAILDNVGNRSLGDIRRVLAPQGVYVMIGGGGVDDHRILGPLGRVLHTILLSRFVSQRMGMMLAQLDAKDLAEMAELMASGTVTPVIDRRYPFDQISAAVAYLEEGHARGKVVVTLD